MEVITFFQDGRGHLHAGRSGGVLYIAAFVVNCLSRTFTPFCLAQAIFIPGWWLAFAKKEMPGTFGKMVRDSRQLAGLAGVTTGLATMSYLTRRGFSLGTIVFPILIASLVFALKLLSRACDIPNSDTE